jgi:hypothetical protein
MEFKYKNIKEIIEVKKKNSSFRTLDPDYLPNHDRNLVIRFVLDLLEDLFFEQIPYEEEAPTLTDFANNDRSELKDSPLFKAAYNIIGVITLTTFGYGQFNFDDLPVRLENQPPIIRFLNRVQTYSLTYFMIMKWLGNDPNAKNIVARSSFDNILRNLFVYYLSRFIGDRFTHAEKTRLHTLFYYYLDITPVQNLMNIKFEYWMDLDPIIQMAQFTFTFDKDKFIDDLGVRDVFGEEKLEDEAPKILKLLSVDEFWQKFSKESFSINEGSLNDPLLVPAQKKIVAHLLDAQLPMSLEDLGTYMVKTRRLDWQTIKMLYNSLYKLGVLTPIDNT